jgi:hypothetical protein
MSIEGFSHLLCRHRSWRSWTGVFEPGGNRGGGRSLSASVGGVGATDLDEFPALPDRTMFALFLGFPPVVEAISRTSANQLTEAVGGFSSCQWGCRNGYIDPLRDPRRLFVSGWTSGMSYRPDPSLGASFRYQNHLAVEVIPTYCNSRHASKRIWQKRSRAHSIDKTKTTYHGFRYYCTRLTQIPDKALH